MKTIDPALALIALLALVIVGFAFLEVGHHANEANLAAAINRDDALLREVRSDEAKYCVAAKASGDQAIIKIVCPKS